MADGQFDRLDLLRYVFSELDERDIEALNSVAGWQKHSAGAVICQEGEIGSTLFVLTRGEVGVYVRGDGDQEIFIKASHPISYFGEMAVLGKTTRAATVRAITDCETFDIDGATFAELVERSPLLLRNVSQQIIEHLRNNDRAIITALRRKNEDLAAAYADLAEQERLRSDFIATLSHELRTPLTSAQGFLHLINKGGLQGDFLRQALDSVTRNVEKMVALINNLLVLYEMRLTLHELAPVNVADLLAEAVGEAKALLPENDVLITMAASAQLPEIQGDKNGLVLALRAIIENALKFNPHNNPVHILIGCPNKGQVRIDIADEGIGIPAESLERIFEPFYRVEGSGASRLFPGLGVGLSIAKFIIERHGGRIEVTSHPAHGTTFTIYLLRS
jgi:signal transduction histidine kinase